MSKARLIAIAGSGVVHAVVVTALLLQPAPAMRGAGGTADVASMEVDLVRSERQTFEIEPEPLAAPAKAASPGAAKIRNLATSPPSAAATPSVGESAGGGGAPPAAAAVAAANYSDYERALFEHIRPYQFYPDGGRAQRLHGVVKVGFVVQRDGKVAQIWIESSSGFDVLDQAAMETIRRAQPLPNIPAALPDSMNVMLPVMFSAPQLLSER